MKPRRFGTARRPVRWFALSRESGTKRAARKYPDELRDQAVRLVLDLVKDQEASVTAACRKVDGELGIKAAL